MGSLTRVDVAHVIAGAILMGYAVAGLFFLRFWRQTHDRFFAIFAASFWLLGVQRVLVSFTVSNDENLAFLYAIRLAAYLLILAAIFDKNRRRVKAGGSGQAFRGH